MSVLTGSTATCTKHYVSKIGKESFIKECARLEVKRSLALRWIQGQVPTGVNLIRLQGLLQKNEYNLIDLPKKTSAGTSIRQLIAAGVRIDVLGEILGYANPAPVLRLVRGEFELPADKEAKLNRYITTLNLKKPELIQSVQVSRLEAEDVNGHTREIGVPDSTPKKLMQIGAAHVKALIPILEYLASDQSSAEDRRAFRQLTGGDGIQKLRHGLSLLSSETTRSSVIEQQQQHKQKDTQ